MVALIKHDLFLKCIARPKYLLFLWAQQSTILHSTLYLLKMVPMSLNYELKFTVVRKENILNFLIVLGFTGHHV